MSAATRLTALLSTLPLLALFGCEEVSNGTNLAQLTETEARILCQEMVETYPVEQARCDFQGVSRVVEIGFDQTVDECMDEIAQRPISCPATAGDLRGCYASLYEMQRGPDACSAASEPQPISCVYLFDPTCTDTPAN